MTSINPCSRSLGPMEPHAVIWNAMQGAGQVLSTMDDPGHTLMVTAGSDFA